MTLLDFLKTSIIIETEDDVILDASTCYEEDLDWWIEDFLYPEIDDEDIVLEVINYPIKTTEDLVKELMNDEAIIAKSIIRSALDFKHIPMTEKTYYINDDSDLHIEIEFDL